MLKSLCRMKERAKRAGAQRKEEESERSALQVMITGRDPLLLPSVVLLLFMQFHSVSQSKLEQTEADLRSLSKEFQGLRTSLAQRDTSVLQLQSTITTLTQKLTAAHRKEVRNLSTQHI